MLGGPTPNRCPATQPGGLPLKPGSQAAEPTESPPGRRAPSGRRVGISTLGPDPLDKGPTCGHVHSCLCGSHGIRSVGTTLDPGDPLMGQRQLAAPGADHPVGRWTACEIDTQPPITTADSRHPFC